MHGRAAAAAVSQQHLPGEGEGGHEQAEHKDEGGGADAHIRLAELGEHVCKGRKERRRSWFGLGSGL